MATDIPELGLSLSLGLCLGLSLALALALASTVASDVGCLCLRLRLRLRPRLRPGLRHSLLGEIQNTVLGASRSLGDVSRADFRCNRTGTVRRAQSIWMVLRACFGHESLAGRLRDSHITTAPNQGWGDDRTKR